MPVNWAPWSILVGLMLLVWVVVYLREGSFSRATIGALVAGKAAAAVYKIVGIDVAVARLYLVHRSGAVKTITIHATDALLLAFAVSLGFTLLVASIKDHLPEPLRRALEQQE